MIKKILILLLCFSLTSTAFAQESQVLMRGEVAPFSGILVSQKEFVEEVVKPQIALEVERKEWKKKEVIYQDALKKAEKKINNPPFLQTFKAGFITGVILIVLVAYVVGQVK